MAACGEDAKDRTAAGGSKLVAIRNWGIVLIIISFVMLLPMFFVHLLPWTTARKVAAYAFIYIAADVVFYLGIGLVGTEWAVRLRRYLNPFRWFRRKGGAGG